MGNDDRSVIRNDYMQNNVSILPADIYDIPHNISDDVINFSA